MKLKTTKLGKLNNKKGFSLVELMVVVAIIGILSTLAIPSVKKYMAKSRQAEAKVTLSGIFTANKAFFSEFNTYAHMFGYINFTPEGNLRYNAGFASFTGANTIVSYGAPAAPAAPGDKTKIVDYCGAGGAMVNGCSLLVDGSTAVAGGDIAAAATVTNTTFLAQARSLIYPESATTDIWTIDQNKTITNTSPGIK